MMSRTRDMSSDEPRARKRREVVRLVRRIQTLFLELEELRRREGGTAELHAKERTVEQLRWRWQRSSDDLHATTWALPRDDNSGLVSSLYNPYAAVPSMHFGSVDATLTSESSQPTRRRSDPFRGAPASVVRAPSSRGRPQWPPRR
jgi:hypothetical protein